jgi:hypothetical protein
MTVPVSCRAHAATLLLMSRQPEAVAPLTEKDKFFLLGCVLGGLVTRGHPDAEIIENIAEGLSLIPAGAEHEGTEP